MTIFNFMIGSGLSDWERIIGFCINADEGWKVQTIKNGKIYLCLNMTRQMIEDIKEFGLFVLPNKDSEMSLINMQDLKKKTLKEMLRHAKSLLELKEIADKMHVFNILDTKIIIKEVCEENFSDYEWVKEINSWTLAKFFEFAKEWKKEHNFIPKKALLFHVGREKLGNKKVYQKAFKLFSEECDECNATYMALTCSVALDKNFDLYFKECKEKLNLDKHDACQLLPNKINGGREVLKAIKKTNDLYEIKQKVKKINKFINVSCKDEKFFKEALKYTDNPETYLSWESRWINRSRECNLPKISVNYNGYKLFLMDNNDPRSLFLGEYTACCQHPNGAGSEAAWYGVCNKDAGFYVVTDSKNKILAQAMTWIGDDKKSIVFDSIELVRKDTKTINKVFSMFKSLSHSLNKKGFAAVNVGTAYGITNNIAVLLRTCKPVPIPIELEYSDAGEQLSFIKNDKLTETEILKEELLKTLCEVYEEIQEYTDDRLCYCSAVNDAAEYFMNRWKVVTHYNDKFLILEDKNEIFSMLSALANSYRDIDIAANAIKDKMYKLAEQDIDCLEEKYYHFEK